MAKSSFQGYARGEGFQQFKVPYNILAQQERRDQQVIRNLQQQQQQEIQRSSQYTADLERKFAKEERFLSENQRLEDTYYSTRREAMRQNQQVERDNTQRRLDAIKQTAANQQASTKQKQELAKMSPKLAEKLIGIKDAIDESAMDAAYNQAIAEGLSVDRKEVYENAVKALHEDSDGIQSFAEAMETAGAPARVVRYIRDGDKSAEIGRLKAIASMAKADYANFVQRSIAEMEPKDATETAQMLEQLQIAYLKENNLYGLNADFLNDLFTEMRSVRNLTIIKAEKQEIIAKDQEDQQDFKLALIQEKTPEAFNNYFKVQSRGYNEKGDKNTKSSAIRQVFTLLEDTSLFSDEEVTYILENTITDQGNSFAARYPQRAQELNNKRLDDREKDRSRAAAEKAAAEKAAVERARDYALNEWDGDATDLQQVIEQLESRGYDSSKIKPFLDNSVESRANYEYWQQEITEAIEEGRLTPEFLSDTDIPKELRDQYRADAIKIADIRKQRGWTDADIKAELRTQIRNALGADTLDKEFQGERSAAAFAIQQYEKLFAQNADTMTPAQAHDAALNQVRQYIADGKGVYYVEPPAAGEAGGATTSYMPYFTPNTPLTSKGRIIISPVIDKNSRLNQIRNDPNLINSVGMIDSDLANTIARQITNNQPVNIPGIYRDLGKIIPNKTAAELLNIQLKLYGHDVQLEDNTQAKLIEELRQKREKDTNAENVIRDIRNISDAARATAMVYSGSRAPVYMNPQYVALGMEQTPIQRFRRAIIGQESGGDYEIINKDSGAIGIGQVMPDNVPSWTKKYYGRSLTPHEYRYNREAQDAVLNGKFRDMLAYYSQQGYAGEEMIRRAAAEWYGGRGNHHLYDTTHKQYYDGVAYPSFREYTTNIWRMYQQGGQ
jgi:hypothetical protein